MMIKVLSFFFLLLLSLTSHANSNCLLQGNIDKWELISGEKLLAYSGEKYLAFVYVISRTYLKPGSDITLRFFSPSICPLDTVVINGVDNKVRSIELIRQN